MATRPDSLRPADTTEEAHRVQLACWRRMGPEGRFRTALQLSDDVAALTKDGVFLRHPEYDDEQLRWAWLRLSLGDALFQKAYPDAPLLAP